VLGNSIKVVERRDKDKYYTPLKAVEPLIPHLPEYGSFAEPCCGNGSLIKHIESLTDGGVVCFYAGDISPDQDCISVGGAKLPTEKKDALTLTYGDICSCDLIVTNSPFKWDTLQPMLDHLPKLKPTWLLLPFGYAANKRMAPYMKICRKVQPIGRVKWIEDSAASSTDDYMWALFDSDFTGTTKLYPRT
jgi:hypothetical protein